MPKQITIPRLGWSMEEGVLSGWLKSAGDRVAVGEALFVLEGDKAAQEVESFDAGVLCIPSDAPQPGDKVLVGQVIGFLLAEGETAPTTCGNKSTQPPDDAVAAIPMVGERLARAAGPAARRLARGLGIDLNAVPTPDPTGRLLVEDVQRAASSAAYTPKAQAIASPRARRLAMALGVDWRQLAGTGRGGRVRERDVVARSAQPGACGAVDSLPPAPGSFHPASRTRRGLAQRMFAGAHQAAPVTLTTKVDAAALVALRRRWRADGDAPIVPSYNDILVKLAAITLKELPYLNACWHAEGIWAYDAIHIAVAVDTDAGLLAPVINHADQLSLPQIAERSRELVGQARAGKLTQRQLQGGTFTITNLGMFDIDCFTPILNLPQAAILGVGRIVREPVVRGEMVVPGETLSLSLTFDHRVVDGAPAARWLQRLAQWIQRPGDELLRGQD